jgi:hypothetical protein
MVRSPGSSLLLRYSHCINFSLFLDCFPGMPGLQRLAIAHRQAPSATEPRAAPHTATPRSQASRFWGKGSDSEDDSEDAASDSEDAESEFSDSSSSSSDEGGAKCASLTAARRLTPPRLARRT